MNIVVEGPDNSGKSTLCDYLGKAMGLYVVRGSRPGTPEEINERCRSYMRYSESIIDRHPAISETIYGPTLRGACVVDDALIAEFYASRPLIIYCRNMRGLEGHVIKPKSADDPDHMRGLALFHLHICRAYDDWALQHANVIYRIGDSMAQVAALMEAA